MSCGSVEVPAPRIAMFSCEIWRCFVVTRFDESARAFL